MVCVQQGGVAAWSLGGDSYIEYGYCRGRNRLTELQVNPRRVFVGPPGGQLRIFGPEVSGLSGLRSCLPFYLGTTLNL